MNVSELESAGNEFVERYGVQGASLSAGAKADGAELASRLRTRAIDLCHNKATEFSPAIGRLFELAAKVALLSHWPDKEALTRYEKDVASTFGNTDRSRKHARDYTRFRRGYLRSDG